MFRKKDEFVAGAGRSLLPGRPFDPRVAGAVPGGRNGNFDAIFGTRIHVPIGAAPSRPDGTRPFCSNPQVAKHKGSGSMNDAANLVCMKEQSECRS